MNFPKKAIVHENYNNPNNNVALLKLDSNVDCVIEPICLPSPDRKMLKPGPLNKCDFEFTGTIFGSDLDKELEHIEFKLTPIEEVIFSVFTKNDKSVKVWDYQDFLDPYDNKKQNFSIAVHHEITKGDSGGPLMVKIDGKWVIFGVARQSVGAIKTSIYTDVISYLPWIIEKMNENQ